MIQAIVFDLDGTLVNLPIDYENLFRQFKKIMKTDNIQPLTKTISKLDEKTKNQVLKVWENTELAVLKDMTINHEGMALYDRFSEKPKALVTMQGRVLVEKTVKSLGLSFNYKVTREDSLDRVQQLRIATKELRSPFQNTLFIGNTEGDLLAARKTKCQFLRVEK